MSLFKTIIKSMVIDTRLKNLSAIRDEFYYLVHLGASMRIKGDLLKKVISCMIEKNINIVIHAHFEIKDPISLRLSDGFFIHEVSTGKIIYVSFDEAYYIFQDFDTSERVIQSAREFYGLENDSIIYFLTQ